MTEVVDSTRIPTDCSPNLFPQNPFDTFPSASFSGSSLPSGCGVTAMGLPPPPPPLMNNRQEAPAIGTWAERERLQNRINLLVSENYDYKRENEGKDSAVQNLKMHQRALTEQKHNLELEVERLGRTLRDVLETATQHEVRVAEVTATNEALYKKLNDVESQGEQMAPASSRTSVSGPRAPSPHLTSSCSQLAPLTLNLTHEATRDTSPVIVLNLQSFICSLETSLRLLQEERLCNGVEPTRSGVLVSASDAFILVGFLKRVREYYHNLCEKVRVIEGEQGNREAQSEARATQLQMRIDSLTQELAAMELRNRRLIDLWRDLDAANTTAKVDKAQVGQVIRQLQALDSRMNQAVEKEEKPRGMMSRVLITLWNGTFYVAVGAGFGYGVYKLHKSCDLYKVVNYAMESAGYVKNKIVNQLDNLK